MRTSSELPDDDSRSTIHVSALAEFIRRHELGESVDPRSFAAQYAEDQRAEIADMCAQYLEHVRDMQMSSRRATSNPVQLGDYVLVRELGRGGMGVVHLAWQASLGRYVALKVLPSGLIDNRRLSRFEREALAGAKLQHPNIARVLAAGEIDDTPYIAMDFVHGHDLAAELQTVRGEREDDDTYLLPRLGKTGYAREVARITKEIAHALDYAHQQGVVHRDIKPQNILLSATGTPCLVDFGLAKELGTESLSRVGELAGTPNYMSPEQALSKRVPIVFSLAT